jgi:hypothetical protein
MTAIATDAPPLARRGRMIVSGLSADLNRHAGEANNADQITAGTTASR